MNPLSMNPTLTESECEDITRRATQLMTDLRATLDPAKRAAEVDEQMRPFAHEWKYAPDTERTRARTLIESEQHARAGEALFALGRYRRDHEPLVLSAVEAAKTPPSPEDAWTRRAGKNGLSAEAYLQLSMLDEMRQSRLRVDLLSAKPAEWLKYYEAALADPTEQECATTMRVIEQLMARSEWSGAPIDAAGNSRDSATREATAVQTLRRRIKDAREARVPKVLRDTAATLKQAASLERTAEEVQKITPRDPAIEGPFVGSR